MIKVTAYGRTNTFQNVSSIHGDFDKGDDVIFLGAPVLDDDGNPIAPGPNTPAAPVSQVPTIPVIPQYG